MLRIYSIVIIAAFIVHYVPITLDAQIDALTPAHVMSRNYLRFETMVLLTAIGVCKMPCLLMRTS